MQIGLDLYAFGGMKEHMSVLKLEGLSKGELIKKRDLKPAGPGKRAFAVALHWQEGMNMVYITGGCILRQSSAARASALVYNISRQTT